MARKNTSEERLLEDQERGRKMLAKHRLLAEDYFDGGRGARWVIGEEGTSAGKMEILAGIFGSLVVHGDFETMRFASYSDRPDAWSRLCWMADCPDVGYYVRQKAHIGMSGIGIGNEYDEEVAAEDLRRFADDLRAERDPSRRELIAHLAEAAEEHTEDRHDLYMFLTSKRCGQDLWECRFGEVLPSHVVVTHQGLARCAALLREKHGDAGPPEPAALRERWFAEKQARNAETAAR